MIIASRNSVVVAVTGSRNIEGTPSHFGANPSMHPIRKFLIANRKKIQHLVTGMAIGVDTNAAILCRALSIPYVAAIPFPNQEKRWDTEDQLLYKELLEDASGIFLVSKGGYSKKKFLTRNKWIVDNSDYLLSIWNGKSKGTLHCMNYAVKQNKTVFLYHLGERRWILGPGKRW